ncbi:MAG: penicillin-binding protein 1B [Methylococcaceae bacterium]|nr:penicillin-binding protein 1B [Methylococcaceae bacterium]MDZ4157320.1 penicillin-binding protein 1B [Methylococcales bacterium]MDP2392609.1 penicillin-binding protein 1B [Methylococcaceae bacterium]MDP3021110.1 penicillin-binding protein 1B [Methylococcaceae bacterium]MDP3388496.1 penicillin-binding protein 1B [Methylococcaceae bacterium]
MAERLRKGGSGRYGTKTPKQKPKSKPTFTWLKTTILIVIVGFALVLASYLGYLDYNIRKQFEGKRWAIPARVYASPVELYAGYNLPTNQFEELLQGLHYRQDAALSSEGTYFRQGQQIVVKTRDFTFWDQQQSSLTVRVSFNDTSITNLVDTVRNKNVAIIRLDPEQIGSLYPTIKEDRILIKLEEAPDTLIKGLLASEDRDFYDHFGVSIKGIARAMWANAKAGGIVQGGSTITQQLAKNFYLSSERSFTRKINEIFMSLILEYRYSKDEILGAYLNEVYLGQDGASAVHGFGLASEFYFGSALKDLPLEHVASLVALVRGPSYYDPRRYPDRALQRRNLVLDEMATEGYITAKQALEAKEKALSVIANTHRSTNRYPGFLDLVKRQLRQEYHEEDLTSEGLRIFTTMDTRAQNILEKTVEKKLAQLEKLPRTENLQTAVVVTRRDSGEIAALMSGREASDAGFNRAIDAVRPIGSLIKPVVYLTALEYPNKYTITTPISDASVFVKGSNGNDWRPDNYDHQEHGVIGLHSALAHSYNHATVRIGMDIGVARIAKTLKSLGVSRPVELYPSFLLGAAQLTPIEVTQMYQTLAGDGFLTPLKAIRAVVAADGQRLQSYPFTVRQVVDPAATYITNTMLQEVMHQGTGKSAYSTFPYDYGLIGKTGTTNDAKDSWFAGYSGDYLAVVWVGRDDNKPAGLTGSTGALQVWIPLMRQISTQPVTLTPPDNVKTVWVDPANGLLANAECAGARQYPYIAGSEPSEYSPCIDSPGEGDKTWLDNLLPNGL